MATENQCFYCDDVLGETVSYHAHFISEGEHVEKELCKNCYKDWLEGIKV
ncbi:hypothetical protein H1D32_12775 [Anaerobacillus sp. CMMVII]|nr:hypothetical protein [Anaerobacillus sp. CMMVII]MCT8138537.1 hypothetical protein [Anaerobacillus sp. CMMVII]